MKNFIHHLLAYSPTYLSQIWHSVFTLGLIIVYTIGCIKAIYLIINY